ncbi:MAG: hypothetical protein HY023_01125 [Chloroflexi bacterium]|nr:hypothetical protein [Chloroflexota bacterium]
MSSPDNLILVFFLYGLAFFTMGLAALQAARRDSGLTLGRAIWLLAAFGLVHASVEWLDMFYLIHRQGLDLLHFPPVRWVRLALLALSLFALNQFGLRLAAAESPAWRWLR